MNLYTAIVVGEITIGLLIWISMAINHSIARKTLDMSLLDIQLKTSIDPGISELLDQFITEGFEEYLLLNVSFTDDKFISSDAEANMVKGLTDLVTDRLSSTMYKQLSVYYNETSIPTIIANKIYMVVMNYVVEYNRAKQNSNKEQD